MQLYENCVEKIYIYIHIYDREYVNIEKLPLGKKIHPKEAQIISFILSTKKKSREQEGK